MTDSLKARLAAGANCLNGWLSIPSGYATEMMARSPWDSLTIDLQHGVHDYASMVASLQAMSGFPVTPLVRVPSNEPAMIGKALDAGAWGIICPMVNSGEEAAELVAACLYPPRGRRSNGPNRAAAYGEAGLYQARANDEVLVIAMIETREAVASLAAILDVPGISGVYVGPSDLGLAYGLAPIFDRDEPDILAIYETIVAETARRGQFAGLHCVDPAYAARMVEAGFQFVTIGSDASFLGRAARVATQSFRQAAGGGGAR